MKTFVTWPLALTLVAACTSDGGENVTTQHSPLTAIGPNIQVSNTGPANAATETAATAFPSSAISGTNVVVSFNYWRPPPPTGGHTTVAWARSIDLGVSFQPSHFADDPGYVIPPITMNNGAVLAHFQVAVGLQRRGTTHATVSRHPHHLRDRRLDRPAPRSCPCSIYRQTFGARRSNQGRR